MITMENQEPGKAEFELSTDLFDLAQLRETDLSIYDSFYLGNPYCLLHRGNFLLSPRDISTAAGILKSEGKKIYVTTPTAPRGDELEEIDGIFQIARDIGADGIEYHNLGILYKASRELAGIPAQAGVFANIYTQVAASLLSEYGVHRIRPNVEVDLDEMEIIEKESPVNVSLSIHGKIPLGIVADCFLLDESNKGQDCPEACLNPAWLKTGEWTLKHVGRGIYSGLDQCLIEHLDTIVERGFRYFRIESGYESGPYRNEVGRVYREALGRAFSGRYTVDESFRGMLGKHAPIGFCNGYLFGRAGRVYVGRTGEELPQSVW